MTPIALRRPIRMLSKVPEVTLLFWIIKVLGTTVGETAADFLTFNLRLGLTGTSIIVGCFLLLSIMIQLSYRKYVPWIYWLTVVLISIAGTLFTDNLVDQFGISLQTTTLAFASLLVATFLAWFWSERTLSIHSIYTTKRELFYWAAILFTFALGTAAGDLVAEGLHIGYALSLLGFASLIAVVAVGYSVFKWDAVASFWAAYILTRPLGASCGDLLTQSRADGGLALGTSTVSIVYLVAIIGLVVYLSIVAKKSKDK